MRRGTWSPPSSLVGLCEAVRRRGASPVLSLLSLLSLSHSYSRSVLSSVGAKCEVSRRGQWVSSAPFVFTGEREEREGETFILQSLSRQNIEEGPPIKAIHYVTKSTSLSTAIDLVRMGLLRNSKRPTQR